MASPCSKVQRSARAGRLTARPHARSKRRTRNPARPGFGARLVAPRRCRPHSHTMCVIGVGSGGEEELVQERKRGKEEAEGGDRRTSSEEKSGWGRHTKRG